MSNWTQQARQLVAQAWDTEATRGLEMDARVVEELVARVAVLLKDSFDQQQGALLWIAAMVDKCGGTVILSKQDQLRARFLELERGDLDDGTTVLRVEEPPKVEPAKSPIALASKQIIVPR